MVLLIICNIINYFEVLNDTLNINQKQSFLGIDVSKI